MDSNEGERRTLLAGSDPEVVDPGGAPMISVCMTTRGRPHLLAKCLDDLARQADAPPFELLVSCQGDLSAAPIVSERFDGATVGYVAQANPGAARNFLVRHARGELLMFLDDDVTFPPTLLRRLFELSREHPGVAVFGGPNITPPGSSTFQVVQGAVLSSMLATGPVRRRYGPHPASEADERFFTLCNMAVRRSRMLEFPPELVCAEENAVLHELARGREKMHYDPELFVFHERRDTFTGFARQMAKYGRGRGQCIVRRPRSLAPAHVAAVAVVAWLLSLPLVSVLVTPWYLLSAAVYFLVLLTAGGVVAVSLPRATLRHRLLAVALGAVLAATVQACYGSGIVRGLLRRRPAPVSEWQPIANAVVVQPADGAA